MPFVFDGVGVIVPGETNDNDLAQGEILGRLSFSSKNMIQIAYLVINTLTICSISNIQHKITKDQIVSIFLTTIKIVLMRLLLNHHMLVLSWHRHHGHLSTMEN